MYCTEIRNMIRSTLLLRRTTYQCFTQLNLCSDVSQNTENVCINPFVFNRNPRNLERLRIAYKPSGYHLEKPGREYWNKLEVTQSNRHVSASLLHCSGKRVLETSTREWSIRKHLYRCTDISAYINIGRVFANRCLEMGIIEMLCDLDLSHTKISALVAEVEKSGIALSEPPRYLPWRSWHKTPSEKPWESYE